MSKVINDYPEHKVCMMTGKRQIECDHCQEIDMEEEFPEVPDYELTAVFKAQFPSDCLINPNHRIRRNDKVGFVQLADNPTIPIKGVVCKWCIKDLPRARK